jgi:hypothetical protein
MTFALVGIIVIIVFIILLVVVDFDTVAGNIKLAANII